jgi:hypothetical protein
LCQIFAALKTGKASPDAGSSGNLSQSALVITIANDKELASIRMRIERMDQLVYLLGRCQSPHEYDYRYTFFNAMRPAPAMNP